MYIDIIAGNKTFNIRIAQLFGLEAAVYLSAVLNEGESQFLKGSSSITINKEIIKNNTTLNFKEQIKYYDIFCNKGIFIPNTSSETITIDFSRLYSLFNIDDQTEHLLKQEVKENSKEFKSEQTKLKYINGLKKCLKSSGDSELDTLLIDWISCIVERFGYMKSPQVKMCQEELQTFCKNDLTIQKEVIKIAIKNCYRDISWAINIYQKKCPSISTLTQEPEIRKTSIIKDKIY